MAGANLERSKLAGVVAIRCDFTDAVLKDANLVRANLKQASFHGANLAGADLTGSDLAGADMRDAILVGAKTYAANMSDTNMTGALTDKLAGKDVSDLPYEAMILDHALWCETQGAQGKPSIFDEADLRLLKTLKGFNLTALSARRAVFYGLNMEGAQLQGAHLEGADFRACNLRRADLRGARLAGARFSGADLREAQMGPLLIGPDRLLPCDLTRAVAKNTDFSGADLRHAIFIAADLTRSRFAGALMKDADLTAAHKDGVTGLELHS